VGYHFMDLGVTPNVGVFMEGRVAFSPDKDKIPSERIGAGLRFLF
jgi:hypothetical protein